MESFLDLIKRKKEEEQERKRLEGDDKPEKEDEDTYDKRMKKLQKGYKSNMEGGATFQKIKNLFGR